MKVSILLLLTMTSFTFGQVKEPECLDLDSPFTLFTPQFKNTSKAKPIIHLEEYLRDSIYIRVNFVRSVRYDHTIKGIAIELFNTTNKDFEIARAFNDLFCQVKYKGDWLTIEKMQTTVFQDDVPLGLVIPPNSYVTAIMPCYQGTKTVTMRYRFAIGKTVMYSEEFNGTVNPKLLE